MSFIKTKGHHFFSLFFLSASVFGFLVFVSPVVSTLLLGLQLNTVFTAPYIGFALTSLLFLFPKVPRLKPKDLFIPAILTFICILIFFYGATQIQVASNHDFLMRASSAQTTIIESLAGAHSQQIKLMIMLLLSLPFIFYSYFLFSIISVETPTTVYAYETLGAALGILSISLFLENLGFQATLILILVYALIGLFFTEGRQLYRRISSALLILLMFLAVFKNSWFEPQRDLHLISRDFHSQLSLSLISEKWTPYSKLQTIQINSPQDTRQIIALGDGTGIAEIPLTGSTRKPFLFPTLIHSLDPQAKNVAVLFAGAGTELVDLAQLFLH